LKGEWWKVAAKNYAGYSEPISLLKCPFCGGNGRIRGCFLFLYTVQCELCGTVPGRGCVWPWQEAVSIWNTRCIVTLRNMTVAIQQDTKPASAGEG
jgi:hypothetical protein